MIELGQLEKHIAEFKNRGVRLVVISVDSQDESLKTQMDFPDLKVVSDANRSLMTQLGTGHPGGGQKGEDIAAPTTILVDKGGLVRWLFRPSRAIERMPTKVLLEKIDTYLP